MTAVTWAQRRAEFHQRGRHDQQTHGNRGTATIEAPNGYEPARSIRSDRPLFAHRFDSILAAHAKDGTLIRARADESVSGLRFEQIRQRVADMLNGVITGYDMAPSSTPPEVLVVDDERLGAPAAVNHTGSHYGRHQILLNDEEFGGRWQWEEFDNYLPSEHPQLDSDHFMPAIKGRTFGEYTGAHEFGHVRAGLGDDDRSLLEDIDPAIARAVVEHGDYISNYGASSAIESHAEAFAEWALSGGKTRNRFARAYAEIFGWGDEDRRALAASAGMTEMPDWDDIEFICDSPFDGPSYILTDGTRLVGKVEFHLAGTQYDHDQSSHAGGRRIAPVSGSTVKQTIESDLTMGALPAKVQTKIRKQFASSLHASPDEARSHLIDMAEAALVKGLTGRHWYQEAHDVVVAAADEHGIDPEVAIAITAALSPGTSWDENRDDALGMLAIRDDWEVTVDADYIDATNQWATTIDKSTSKPNSTELADANDTIASLYARDPKLAAVYIAKRTNASVGYGYDKFFKATDLLVTNDPDTIDGTLNGVKVRSFYNNLARPQGTDGDVTVDVHMQRAMANNSSSTTPQQKHERTVSIKKRSSSITGSPSFNGAPLGAMPLMADVIREATVEFNDSYNLDLLPHEFQAVVWTEQIAQYSPSAMTRILRGDDL